MLQAKKELHASHMEKMNQLQQENEVISGRMEEQHKRREVLQKSLVTLKNDLSQINSANVSKNTPIKRVN